MGFGGLPMFFNGLAAHLRRSSAPGSGPATKDETSGYAITKNQRVSGLLSNE